MTEIEKGNTGSVQGLSVAVDTHRQHSFEGLVAVLDAARGLTVVVVGRRATEALRPCRPQNAATSSTRSISAVGWKDH